MKTFAQSPIVAQTAETIDLMYKSGWDERNGGNLSYLLYANEVEEYTDILKKDSIEMGFDVPELAGCCFLVTGAGKYFKNVKKDPEGNLGLIKISGDGKKADLLWGFTGGGRPTSELSSHLMGHTQRLKQDKEHRIVMHSHPVNIIALSYIIPQDEKILTFSLWQMISECVIIFPEGIGIVPWMVPGTDELGKATADKMAEFRVIFWPRHGVFSTGNSLDDAFGLLEVVEKAAEIYIKVRSCVGTPPFNITPEELMQTAKRFNLNIRKDFLKHIA